MMMTDGEIRAALAAREIGIDPLDEDQIQPASYDARLGVYAFTSSSKDREKSDLSQKGLLIIEPGEFAVVETRERFKLNARSVAQIGLRSEFSNRGLVLLSGPQIDPGFEGVLIVRLINLAPKPVAIPFQAPFLTLQFFRLAKDVERPYAGRRQGQGGISASDIQELIDSEGLTLGQVMKTLSALARDVGTLAQEVSGLRGSVGRLTWLMPLVVGAGLTLMAVLLAWLK